MLNVGLTGNIAAGKSTVVELFRSWGATIIDADQLAREAQAPGTEVLAAIVRRFGGDVLHPDGTLDRAALRSKVMGDDQALA
ncbi:MAG TPA: dephospho-CoA kinase, partial [Gemmatimonadales bacterium]|nr:dephospho-CoA kinase [Gemmatimonadales bacterium]